MKKRIAVVGPGLIGREHVKLIQASQRCELAAIVAPDKATLLYVAICLSYPNT